MNCEKCNGRSVVLETRTDRDKVGANEYKTVFRRRRCPTCNITWSTTEIRNDRLDDYDMQRRAESAEGKLRTVKAALSKLFNQL